MTRQEELQYLVESRQVITLEMIDALEEEYAFSLYAYRTARTSHTGGKNNEHQD